MTAASTNTSAVAAEKINIQHLIPRFVQNSDISTYLEIFERQCEQVNIGEVDYVTHLLPMLPIDISHIILREPKDKLENYQHIKQVLLHRFKLNAESFLMKFSTHQKQPKALWKDFTIWFLPISLRKELRKEVKEHFVDIWGDIKSSSELVQKLDDYEVAQAAFEKTVISLSFADGIITQKEVLRTFQTVILEGRTFKTPFIILPDAKNNSTLLGVDFLENAGIVLNFRKNCWTFWDDFQKSYNFVTPYQNTSVNVWPVAINNCQLREDEGQELLGSQRVELDSLLRNHHSLK
ncbi:retrovirus-related Pol polyprotein from transposon 17.6 [Trichonephila clavipes]|nr:retrovirus-related Pol polyprotein from transposon 17.6 [Trichonephila clavipes]